MRESNNIYYKTRNSSKNMMQHTYRQSYYKAMTKRPVFYANEVIYHKWENRNKIYTPRDDTYVA